MKFRERKLMPEVQLLLPEDQVRPEHPVDPAALELREHRVHLDLNRIFNHS